MASLLLDTIEEHAAFPAKCAGSVLEGTVPQNLSFCTPKYSRDPGHGSVVSQARCFLPDCMTRTRRNAFRHLLDLRQLMRLLRWPIVEDDGLDLQVWSDSLLGSFASDSRSLESSERDSGVAAKCVVPNGSCS